METPKLLSEFFKLFTKPREVIIEKDKLFPRRKKIKYLTRTILLLEQERKWYLEHDENDMDYILYLDKEINKLVEFRNRQYNGYLHEVIKYKAIAEEGQLV